MMKTKRCDNYFASGPAHLPEAVLNQLTHELYNFKDTGISILEISHRHAYIQGIIEENIQLLKQLLHIPDDFAVLFMAGGASHAFANIPLNLLGKRFLYLNQGRWSERAFVEAAKIDSTHIEYKLDINNYDLNEIKHLAKECDFIHYVHNETAHGIQWHEQLQLDKPLIADMSSDLLCTEAINWSRHAIVYAGGSKNLGIAGFNLIIINKELLKPTNINLPSILSFDKHYKSLSLYSTPPIIQYYVMNLMLKWTQQQGDVEFFYHKTQLQSELIYSIVDQYPSIYCNQIVPQFRSWVNMVFDINPPELLEKFLTQATNCYLLGLKGHRDTGGIRVSAYNSISLKQVKLVAELMNTFAKENI